MEQTIGLDPVIKQGSILAKQQLKVYSETFWEPAC
jgi:hypothetical protein